MKPILISDGLKVESDAYKTLLWQTRLELQPIKYTPLEDTAMMGIYYQWEVAAVYLRLYGGCNFK